MDINRFRSWSSISILIGLYAGVAHSVETKWIKGNEVVSDQFDSSALHEKANSVQKHLKAGRPDLAVTVLDDIIRQAKLPEDSYLLASSLLNRGIAKAEQQQLDMAHLDFLEAAKMATQFQHSGVAVKAYLNAAQNQMSLGHTLEARYLLNSSNEWFQLLKPVLEKAELELAFGHLWQLNQLSVSSTEEKSSEVAYEILNDAIEISQSLHRDDLLSYGYGYLAAVYLDNGRFDDALRLTAQAEFLAQAIQRPDLLFRWQWQMGRILARQKKRLEAIANYQRAIVILQPIRSEFRGQSNTVNRLDFDDLYSA